MLRAGPTGQAGMQPAWPSSRSDPPGHVQMSERCPETDLEGAWEPVVSAAILGAVWVGGTDCHPWPVMGVVGCVIGLKPELALDSLAERDLLADGPVRHQDAWPAQAAYLLRERPQVVSGRLQCSIRVQDRDIEEVVRVALAVAVAQRLAGQEEQLANAGTIALQCLCTSGH